MTLLEIIQEACRRTGLPVPVSAMTSTDPSVRQMICFLNELLTELTNRWMFEELMREATFTSVATESQGLLSTLAPLGFMSIIPGTFYNRSTGLIVEGPVSASQWQQDKALSTSGAIQSFRIRNSEMLFDPVPQAGESMAFEYRSNACLYNSTSATYKSRYSDDGDTFLLDDNLLLLGLRYKWKAEKGLAYAEDLSRFEIYANDLAGRSGSKPVLDMGGYPQSRKPGVIVPPGSWNV